MAKIKHITIATQKPSETAKFYQDVFEMKSVGKIEGENAEGYYLSDGDINLAILKFKNDTVAGELGIHHEGLHHIGFQVDDLEATDAKPQEGKLLTHGGDKRGPEERDGQRPRWPERGAEIRRPQRRND